MKKSKFTGLNLGSIEILSKEQQAKIKGGGYYQCYGTNCPPVSANQVPGCNCYWLPTNP